MDTYQDIEQKLHQFVRKFYISELIKGGILFFSLGFLYLFFTLCIEYFFWLIPTYRTLLFWVFIALETSLLFRYILIPIFKIIGFRKGISLEASSKIIGNHFPKVGDKLLNVLQLKEVKGASDLLLASIEQKSKEIQPIPFTKAVNFKSNATYLKYAIVPFLIWILIGITGNSTLLNTSFKRVVNHRTAYTPPAPFVFQLVNESLEVLQGKPFTVVFKTIGTVTPSDMRIFYNGQDYFLQQQNGAWSYTFTDTRNSTDFYIEANEIISQAYRLQTIKTPTIQNIALDLKYPPYVGKKNERITNTGTVLIPEGTNITWFVTTKQTDTVSFITTGIIASFLKQSDTVFRYRKKIVNPIFYEIATSNTTLKQYEKLSFKIGVVKDEYPKIEVFSEQDSLAVNFAQFAGSVQDDYGLKKLELVYFNEDTPQEVFVEQIKLTKQQQQTFYYAFPGTLNLQQGVNYELYFQVYDTDAINGSKKTKSRVFNFRNKSEKELEATAIASQKKQINSIEKSLRKQEQQKEALQKIAQNLQNKKTIRWDDKKKIQNFIKRQEQYKKMMQQQTKKLQENIKDFAKDSKSIQEKKEQLKERLEELKKLQKEQRLLDELERVAKKLNKEDLLKKVKELAEQNKQQERSLERVLELTKRFYIEQKTMQISTKLEELSKKQDSVRTAPKADVEQQKEIQKEFSKIQQELKELKKDNKDLKEPMQIPDTKAAEKEIEKALEKAGQSQDKQENEEKQDNQEKQEKQEGAQKQDAKSQNKEEKKDQKKSQKKAAKKMQEMSQKMQQAMLDMEGEMKEENKKSLRIILENLLHFSFKQEGLMDRFSEIDVTDPDFGKELTHQNTLKTYFEHIDDSLYVLSMRLPEIAVKIQKDLTEAHYNLDQSLENFSDNKFSKGQSNQQYVMTAVNNLADFLSNILDNMQQPKMSQSGKGKKGGKSFSLPDIIQKQEGLKKKMKEGQKKEGQGKGEKGDKKGTKKGGKKEGEDGDREKGGKGKGKKGEQKGESKGNRDNGLEGELYEIYKQQAELRAALQQAIQQGKTNNPMARKVLKTMEELESEILEKGFNAGTIQKMQELKYNLLKLDTAAFEQDKDKQRKSTTNQQLFQQKQADLFIKKQFYNQTEILNRQSLPLQKNYKEKVEEYFKNSMPKKAE